jgi:hypothetical protein
MSWFIAVDRSLMVAAPKVVGRGFVGCASESNQSRDRQGAVGAGAKVIA